MLKYFLKNLIKQLRIVEVKRVVPVKRLQMPMAFGEHQLKSMTKWQQTPVVIWK